MTISSRLQTGAVQIPMSFGTREFIIWCALRCHCRHSRGLWRSDPRMGNWGSIDRITTLTTSRHSPQMAIESRSGQQIACLTLRRGRGKMYFGELYYPDIFVSLSGEKILTIFFSLLYILSSSHLAINSFILYSLSCLTFSIFEIYILISSGARHQALHIQAIYGLPKSIKYKDAGTYTLPPMILPTAIAHIVPMSLWDLHRTLHHSIPAPGPFTAP